MKTVIDDLREKRLWPVAAALLVALVAVPMLLSKSSSPAPAASVAPTSGAAAAPPVAGLPVVSVQSGLGKSRLNGSPRDPFQQQSLGSGSASAPGMLSTTPPSALSAPNGGSGSSKSGSGSAGPGGSGSSSSKSSSSKSSSSGSGGSSPSTTTPSSTPTPTPAKTPPAVSVLSDTESYHVALAMTNSSGGLNTLDPLERLSILPNKQEPLMVELGVLKGGKRVLFALQPGAVVSGPGTCTPGPIDCEVLSLAVNQIENLGVQSASGVSPVTMFAVTAIKADKHPSPGAAWQARNKASAAGRALLKSSDLSALSLFQYKPSLGALVSLQNLKVGGST